MIGAALILAGYAAIIWTFGWLGLVGAGLHVAVLLAGMWRRPP